MKTYNNLLHMYKKEMALKDIPSETMKVFLFELCNERNIDLYLNLDNEASEEFIEVFNEGAKRILNHEPMNYVLGYCWFYGYKLKVNKDVLIPRYETEELVGNILARVDEYYGDYGDLAYKLDDYEAKDLIESLYRYKPYLFKEIFGDCDEKA